jgi:hypothetical protein
MAVYKNSRYEETYLFQDDVHPERTFIDPIRTPQYEPVKEDFMVEVKEGDRLDILANELYGDENLEWILMDANPQYTSPLDIKPGDFINVPNPERVGMS